MIFEKSSSWFSSRWHVFREWNVDIETIIVNDSVICCLIMILNLISCCCGNWRHYLLCVIWNLFSSIKKWSTQKTQRINHSSLFLNSITHFSYPWSVSFLWILDIPIGDLSHTRQWFQQEEVCRRWALCVRLKNCNMLWGMIQSLCMYVIQKSFIKHVTNSTCDDNFSFHGFVFWRILSTPTSTPLWSFYHCDITSRPILTASTFVR